MMIEKNTENTEDGLTLDHTLYLVKEAFKTSMIKYNNKLPSNMLILYKEMGEASKALLEKDISQTVEELTHVASINRYKIIH